ncbi:hypothetical protein E5288_WYG000472 [Bos mutus]|uniref:Uncharacterized protein n=1 Tax=Bos mutus TaxID=72004 RepID=A0A6B0QPS0_9CETA|nr:hypothetical protein [Bos mutus]
MDSREIQDLSPAGVALGKRGVHPGGKPGFEKGLKAVPKSRKTTHPQPGSCARIWSDGTAADQTLKSKSPTEPIAMTSFHLCSPDELQGIRVPEETDEIQEEAGLVSLLTFKEEASSEIQTTWREQFFPQEERFILEPKKTEPVELCGFGDTGKAGTAAATKRQRTAENGTVVPGIFKTLAFYRTICTYQKPARNSWLQLRRRAGPGLPLVSPIQGSTDHGISIDALLPTDTLATWIPLCKSMAIQREKAMGQEGHSTTPFIRTAPQTLEHLSFQTPLEVLVEC